MSGDYSNSEHELRYIAGAGSQGEKGLIKDAGEQIKIDDSADWAFGSGNFTIELFGVEFTVLTNASHTFCSQWNAGSNDRSWWFMFRRVSPSNVMRVLLSNDGVNFTEITEPWSPSVDTPYDVCLERDGDTIRGYLDGSMLLKGTHSGTLHDSTEQMIIGAIGDNNSDHEGRLRYRAMRVTKGVARYATDTSYTVPGLPLPTQ